MPFIVKTAHSPAKKTEAVKMAHSAIKAAGFTPCIHSEFVHMGQLFAFSVESNGGVMFGPAFDIVIDIETGAVVR